MVLTAEYSTEHVTVRPKHLVSNYYAQSTDHKTGKGTFKKPQTKWLTDVQVVM